MTQFDQDAVDSFLSAVAKATARELECAAAAMGLAKINEQRHLQPAAASAARRLAESSEPAPMVSTQYKLSFPEWPRLGGVDLTLQWEGQLPVLVELKCGAGNDALGPCVWDAAKLAFASQRGTAAAGYLLAGAPTSSWNKPIRGCEFFGSNVWEIKALRSQYADWWKHWEKCGDPQPTQLPLTFSAIEITTVPLLIAETQWELRLTRLATRSDGWLEWPKLLSPTP